MQFVAKTLRGLVIFSALGLSLWSCSMVARADDLNLGVAVPGLSLYLGDAPRYYVAPPVVYAPPRPVYYQPAPRWHRGPPPWARRWHHERDRDWHDDWRDDRDR